MVLGAGGGLGQEILAFLMGGFVYAVEGNPASAAGVVAEGAEGFEEQQAAGSALDEVDTAGGAVGGYCYYVGDVAGDFFGGFLGFVGVQGIGEQVFQPGFEHGGEGVPPSGIDEDQGIGGLDFGAVLGDEGGSG